MKPFLYIYISLISLTSCFSFTPPSDLASWWSNNVNWDGVSHHSEYITFSSDKMGPNALPVPHMKNGLIDSISFIGFGGAYHFYGPDPTQNINLHMNYVVIKDFLSFDWSFIVQEFYNSKITQESHELKTERNVFFENYDQKNTVGDLNVQFNFQILKENPKGVDLMGRIGYRFPTSSAVETARYTDHPGYFISLSSGKRITQSKNTLQAKIIAELGFLAYQTNDEQHFQNDAPYYGTGIELAYKNVSFTNSLEGYYGYLNNGDQPLLYRSAIRANFKKLMASLRFQAGLNDYRYKSLELIIGYRLNFIPKYKLTRTSN